ncbi:Thiamine pyrophosphate enzyme, C-terminal TPP-binding [Dillenia turbinata]|uniref:Thiamine pyrophosphate enzyme, C-terminal TPP-binding n=1 Tax=Dillenia turbinata TaxID=194707 RepID=A0AAN8VKI6_9MAGN
MTANPLPLTTSSPTSTNFHLPNIRRSLLRKPHSSPPFRFPSKMHFLSLSPNPNFKLLSSLPQFSHVVRLTNSDDFSTENNDFSDSILDFCVTRTLSPALTLQRGIEKIKEALENLKSEPPCFNLGILRIQVAVPPSAKALNLFWAQDENSLLFPQFYLSRKEISLDCTREVFGIGAAVEFMTSSSCSSGEWKSFKRCLSVDSPLIIAYGLLGAHFNRESSLLKHESGAFYCFIPQIELVECDGISLLAATLAWNDCTFQTFEHMICSLESSLLQASYRIGYTRNKCKKTCMASMLKKFGIKDDANIQMVRIDAPLLDGMGTGLGHFEPEVASCSSQFLIRLMPTIAVSCNVHYHTTEIYSTMQSCCNINAVWASLIIEECTRLGITYFCVAPGSRSSPLAIAACSHPLATCIACFDERSLAFHAVGYGRGSRRPAVVITSSGTAVSNLLPAVVEASQDFVPLLVLTADRPPELQDTGANQAINQVNHFGSFVRFFFSLPPPTDHILARMVLTTVDSAVHLASSSPYGPVHINCPFREPLENSPRNWMTGCLKGLEAWMSNAKPFTSYIQVHHSSVHINSCDDQMAEVIKIIQGASKGLLLVGAIHEEDERWAATLLCQHLSWPVIADILSGLRMRNFLGSFTDIAEKFLFLDHLDNALLSDSVRAFMQPDVIIQVGSKVTSKRVYQMLEDCFPCSYIMVEEHPHRHDPAHIVTHRIQCSVIQFVNCLLKAQLPELSSNWTGLLRTLNLVVSREISSQICYESSLTEPHVVRAILESLSPEAALFIGNSMVIRDADMYGCNWVKCTHNILPSQFSLKLPFQSIWVTGNRGASGIDGLLSTSVGFAVGCNKRVLCMIGDISFLHDTNGLAILNQRIKRKPMTVIVINNHGGAIFSLLPVADKTARGLLDKFFYTSHSISIRELCMAHSVKHFCIQTKVQLQDALLACQSEDSDCVIEVESSIDANALFHRVPLCAPPTFVSVNGGSVTCYREGFILALTFEDGSVGYGEVAPLESDEESLSIVEDQLRFLVHVIEGVKISYLLPLLSGSFSSWIWSNLGIHAHSLSPSVRCGFEMAVLNAIAAMKDTNLVNVIYPLMDKERENSERSSTIRICALVDSVGGPAEIASIASDLVDEGFTTIKLKVARRLDPVEDAAVVKEVRKKVGSQIELRVDANRKWSYDEAVQFAFLVKPCKLQYIEEPVQSGDDIIRFSEETGLPVALDETIDNFQGNLLESLGKFAHTSVVAVVIKPSVVGGFETAAMIAKWAQQKGKMAVISSAYETGLGLCSYIQFSHFLDLQNAEICKATNKENGRHVAHGLGTYQWLKEDVMSEPLRIYRHLNSGMVEASIEDAHRVLQNFQLRQNTICRSYGGEQIQTYQLAVKCKHFSFTFKVQEVGRKTHDNVVLFLHGFLGTGRDWIPIMKAISGAARCIAVDLPGHGESKVQVNHTVEGEQDPRLSLHVIADALCELIKLTTHGKVALVGYSMGARIALYMSLRLSNKIEGSVIISGSPGLINAVARKIRIAKDDSRARFLVACGLQHFLDTWYSGELWDSLRGHPHFDQIVAARMGHGDVQALAKALSDLSVGRQPSLWEDLKQCKTPLLLIVGEKDQKFKKIASDMCNAIEYGSNHRDDLQGIVKVVVMPDCGHAIHIENPLPLIRAIRQFVKNM